MEPRGFPRLKLTKDQRLDHKEEVLSVEIARPWASAGQFAKTPIQQIYNDIYIYYIMIYIYII
jgi:hypothetical protein